MEPKILILGTDEHYHRLYTDRVSIKTQIPEMQKLYDSGNCLGCLVDTFEKFSVRSLSPVGPSVVVNNDSDSEQKLLDCLDGLFIKVKERTKYHNAPFAVVDELSCFNGQRETKASLVVQLYVKA